MTKFTFLCKELWAGKSVLRAYLNFHLKDLKVTGKTVDVGGGGGSSVYLEHIQRGSDVEIKNFDPKIGTTINFETDCLPVDDGFYDTVLFLNVMEHIFNYQHIANEVMRITKNDGQMIGYVPFLMWYHPDSKDFFRYTHEALQIIFERAGAKNIEITPNYCGPFIAAAQMMMLSVPRIIRPIIFTLLYALDELFFLLKGKKESRFVLGYLFLCSKS
jgi:hypothetical protein